MLDKHSGMLSIGIEFHDTDLDELIEASSIERKEKVSFPTGVQWVGRARTCLLT